MHPGICLISLPLAENSHQTGRHSVAVLVEHFDHAVAAQLETGLRYRLSRAERNYSIPHRYVGRTLVVSATLNTVRILDAGAVLATHPRSFDRGQQIEDPAHIEELERHKRLAREHRATDRLHHAAPSAKALFVAAAQRNHRLGVLVRGLIELLNAHGPVALERAIASALDADAAYLGGGASQSELA